MKDYYFNTKNYSQTSPLALADRLIESVKERFINQGWAPLVFISRSTIISLMKRIVNGQLTIITKDETYRFGNPIITSNTNHQSINQTQKNNSRTDRGEVGSHPNDTSSSLSSNKLKAEIRVRNESFWVRMLLQSDLGFAEAYMMGDIEVDNLDSLFKIFILNRSNLSEMSIATSSIYSGLNSIMNSRFINSISNSISNISAHYDISNEMFKSFLSSDMTYSCAYFTDLLGGLEGDLEEGEGGGMLSSNFSSNTNRKTRKRVVDDELEAAQIEKLDLIIGKAKISKNDRVLEIGSGWGSFSIRAVQKTGCLIDSITLSIEQKVLAEKRINELGLQDSIRIHLLDYRNLPKSFENRFDRLVSIEMIEGVGLEYLETYFSIVNKCLKVDRGVGVFQVITIPESRFDRYKNEIDFIRKWIFPGGVLPSVTFLTNCINKGSNNQLIIESIENIGPHYARTLREWERRFKENFEAKIKPDLIKTYFSNKNQTGSSSSSLNNYLSREKEYEDEILVFKRKWIYYFEYCASGFSSRVLGDHIFTITREGNLSI